MKKSPFIIALMAALLGVQPALATVFEGGTADTGAKTYIGTSSETDVTYALVKVTAGDAGYGEDFTAYGAYVSGTGKAALSGVIMEGGTVAGACGGYSAGGNAVYTGVTLTGGTVTGDVYGGHSMGGATQWDMVTLGADEGTAAQAQTVYGGYSGTADEKATSWDNDVEVKNTGHAGAVFGGVSEGSESYQNTVTVTGTVDNSIAGGVGGTISYENKVTISGNAQVATSLKDIDKAYVCGGSAAQDAYQNTVTISGNAEVDCNVIGGLSTGDASVGNNNNARQNTVIVENGRMTASVYGGYSADLAFQNRVEIKDGVLNNVYGALSTDKAANNNTVIVSGGIVTGTLAGAQASTVSNNRVHLVGQGIENLDIHQSSLEGNVSANFADFMNEVPMKDQASHVFSPQIFEPKEEMGEERVNYDKITGSIILEHPILNDNAAANDATGAGITGHAMMLGDVYGAIDTDLIPGESSGNTVDVYGYDITAISLQGMQKLNFHMVAEIENTSTAMLNLTSENSGRALVLGPELSLNFEAMDLMTWKPGDSVTLVSSALGINVDPYLLAKEYNIYQYGSPEQAAPVGKGVLKLEQNNTILKLVVPMVPEPATGTLGLLALAALAARRRKH